MKRTLKENLLKFVTRFVNKVATESEKTSFFTVVDRSCYREWQMKLPMNDAKEARKALALSQDEFDGSILRKAVGGGYKATCWRYMYPFKSKGLIFPESIVLASRLPNDHYAEISDGEAVIFVANSDGAVHSARKTQLMPTAQDFAVSVGINANHYTNLDDDGYAGGILALLTEWPRFRSKAQRVSVPLWRWAAPVLLVLALYLGVSSLYLTSRLDTLEAAYNQNSEALNSALQLQTELEQRQQKLQALAEIQQRAISSFPIWKVLMPLYQQPDVSLRRITKTDEGFELFGQAKRATDILRMVTDMPGVTASFNRPVSSRRGEETFSIALSIDYVEFSDWMPEEPQ